MTSDMATNQLLLFVVEVAARSSTQPDLPGYSNYPSKSWPPSCPLLVHSALMLLRPPPKRDRKGGEGF